jgi:hypothetical protein
MDELDRVAYRAVVRTAPRFGRIIGTGIVVGGLVGAVLGFALPNSTGVGRGMVALLIGLGFACIGGLVTAVIATGVDRTSSAPTGGFPWEQPDAGANPVPEPTQEAKE